MPNIDCFEPSHCTNLNMANDNTKLDLAHWRTDANLYPPERQLTKASGPLFDLEGGAKSDHIRRFPLHDFLQVGFTLQT